MRAVVLVVLAVACAKSDPQPAGDTDLPYDGPPQLSFLAVDNGAMKLVYVDEIGGGGWTTQLPVNPRDVARAGDDEVLVSHELGAVRVSLATGEVTWTLDTQAGVTSARPLDNGHVLLGEQDGADVALVEVDDAGVEVSRVTAPGYADLRLVRRLDDGHTLFTTSTDGFRVVEVDATGAEVWTAPLPGKGYVAERLSNGHTLATTGEDAQLLELDADGATVHAWGGTQAFPDLGLVWFSGFERLDGDVAVVANWFGHDTSVPGPHVVALDGDNQLVWSWDDRDAAVQVTNVLVLGSRGF